MTGKNTSENDFLYRQYIDSLPAAVYITDAQGRLMYFNQAAVAFSGREPEIGTDQWYVAWKLYHPDGTPMPHDTSPMAVILEEGRNITGMEIIAERPDGKCIWFEPNSAPIRDGGGTIVGGINMLVNITHRKENEEKQLQQSQKKLDDFFENAREKEKKYRFLFESLDEGFCIIKVLFDEDNNPVDYRFLETNASFEKQTGLKDSVNKTMRELAPDHEEYWFELYGRIALTGEPARFENYAKALNRWFNVYAFRIGHPNERMVTILFSDVTKQKEVQKERERLLLKERTERKQLSEIFQTAPSFMCILRGRNHVVERANDMYLRMIGNREIIGKPIREAVPELEGQEYFELLDKVFETGEPYTGTEMKILLQSHGDNSSELSEHFIDFVYQPLRNSAGTINGIFVQGVDLTERKHAKEELQAINETLEERIKDRTAALLTYQDQLRSLVSQLGNAEERERQRLAAELHDNLGQTLAIGKMKLDLLQKGGDSEKAGSDITELAELINEAIRYTRELMSDLKPPPALNKENLKENIAWLLGRMKKYDLEVTISDDGEPKLLGEETRTTILQCVRELLFNVVKHAEVTSAHISLVCRGEQIQVTVEDDGKGFDPDKEKLAPTKEGRFGLFNLFERMDLLGGSFKITSKPGKGTKAILLAPAKREKTKHHSIQSPSGHEVKTNASSPAVEFSKGSKIKVLLVDDHKMMRAGLRRVIEEEQDLTIIAEASDGKEAVKMAKSNPPDVIVMDVNMPDMDGIQATRNIINENSNIRIIGLSLHDNKNVSLAMKRAGASAYLTKTDAFEALCATIRSEAGVKP